jgi:NitT/TauT family transport system substrate-binding protein
VKIARLAAFFAVLSGCVAGGAQADPVHLRIQYGSGAQLVPIIPLAPKELYKHYGTSYVVEPYFMAGAGPALTALASGDIDLAVSGPQSLATAVLEAKLDLHVIAQVFSIGVPGWHKDSFWAKHPINSLAELKGKTIAVNARGGTADAAVHLLLDKIGLKDGADYQLAELRFPAVLPAIETGQVDTGILIEPFARMAAAKGDVPIFSTADAFGAVETVVWAGKADWIAKNRAALVDFLEDHLRLRHWATDPATRMEAVKLVAKADKVSVDTEAQWLFTHEDNYRDPAALVDVARFQKNIDDVHRAGLTSGTLEAAKYIDTSIAHDAAARLSP